MKYRVNYILLILFFSLSSCEQRNQEKKDDNLIAVQGEQPKIEIIKKDLLDTVIYQNRAFPPRGLLVENLEGAPIIVEGRILHADSVFGILKVVTFKIDSVWKGNIDIGVIKYSTANEFTVKEYDKYLKKHKELAFIKQRKKEKLYDYPDSIEYSPYIDFSIFPLDRAFKEYMLQLKHSATISNHNTKRKQ